MDLKKKKFQKMFPNLAQEITTGKCVTKIDSVKPDNVEVKKIPSTKYIDYSPNVIDFLQRCEKVEQAEEIICYLEKKKEINSEHAKKLRKQLKTKGLRSFGAKKENDYYLKNDGF
ncbi:DUF2095 family protein [Candidatus Bathyarchaeota archaeon]|nr:DUF2095 family protein [Candidatus Bathyarchaeota archaeon]